MKKYKLNPDATTIDLMVVMDIQQLEENGCDFAKQHNGAATFYNLSIDAARQKNYRDYKAVVILRTIKGKIHTVVQWNYYLGRERYVTIKETSDDKMISIIIRMLQAETLRIKKEFDLSINNNKERVPTFICV